MKRRDAENSFSPSNTLSIVEFHVVVSSRDATDALLESMRRSFFRPPNCESLCNGAKEEKSDPLTPTSKEAAARAALERFR